MSNINRPPLLHRIASYLFGWEWHLNRIYVQFDYNMPAYHKYRWQLTHYCFDKQSDWDWMFKTISSYRYMPTLRRLRKEYNIYFGWYNGKTRYWYFESNNFTSKGKDFRYCIRQIQDRHWWLRIIDIK